MQIYLQFSEREYFRRSSKIRISERKCKFICNFPSVSVRKFLHILWNCRKIYVTLQDFSAFLCIKAVWGIEEKAGYE